MRLFAYGTLAFPAVVEALLERRLHARPARLEGFSRRRLRDRVYPGIVALPGAATQGVVIEGLGPRDLKRLDAFEGPLYERRRVEVTGPGSVRLPAETYVIAEARRALATSEPWSRERFERHHLAAWVRHCARVRRALAPDVG